MDPSERQSRPRRPWRLTPRVFWDLAVWMTLFGLAVGLAFPFFSMLLGVPAEQALSVKFFAAALGAGALVGTTNYALARAVVGRRLRVLNEQMQVVENSILDAMYSGDWSAVDPKHCTITVDSEDELGQSAAAFNGLVEALARSHHVEDSLRGFSSAVAGVLELHALGERALASFRQLAEAEAGAVMVHEGGDWRTVAASGLQSVDGLASSAPVREALRTGRTIRTEVADDVTVDAGLVRFRPRWVAAMPVEFRSHVLGVVALAAATVPSPETESRLEMFRQTFGVALNNALTHARLETLAVVDPLTGLYNRRFGAERLREEFARAKRAKSALGLLTWDIDHFKTVNDTHGHPVGDRLLVATAEAAREVFREGDTLVRHGGDEFLAILPGAAVEHLHEIGERLRVAIADACVPEEGQPVACTISVGGVAFPATASENSMDLLRLADEALYESKRAGRDRLTVLP